MRQNDPFIINFDEVDELTYTKPQSFSYFGEERPVATWTDLYTCLFGMICEDHPHAFSAGMSFSKSHGRVDLQRGDAAGEMVAPKPVPNTPYMLETNLNAKSIIGKIRFILDLCDVDHENVVIKYRRKEAAAIPLAEVSVTQGREIYTNELYTSVLKSHFTKGFRMGSPLEIRRFRRYYAAVHRVELMDTDEAIADTMKRLCIIYDGKAYLPAVMLREEIKAKLFKYIEDCFANGKTTLYYQAIYAEFADEFLDSSIYDAEMLKAYLAVTADGRYYINRSVISEQTNITLDHLSEIRACLREYGRPVEYQELFAALPHLPPNKVKFILASNGEFINNGHGAYFHESVVTLSDEELSGITNVLKYAIREKGFVSGNELYDAIKAKFPYIIENNTAFSIYGFRDALKYKLRDRFSFKGNIISQAGRELSMADVFANFARSRDSFSLAELQVMAAELATAIYFDPVYENSLRISQEQFVAKYHARFSVADTDAAIDKVCVGKYIPLQEVTNFGAFPYAGFPWNVYLLEHYVAEYSQKYKLLHNNYNGTTCAGAIVKRNAGIETFDDLIVELLATHGVELKKAPALQFLSDKGYLSRRRYGNIEPLIIKANAKRNRKDTDQHVLI